MGCTTGSGNYRGARNRVVRRKPAVVADPNGNREQRRAARKLGVVAPAPTPVPAEVAVCVRCCEPIDGPVEDAADGPRHAGGCGT